MEFRRCGDKTIPAAFVTLAIVGTIGAVYLLDVFTWHGLVYTIGLGSSDGLLWPAGTRIVTLLLALSVAAGISAVLDWREGRLAHRSHGHALLLGYATCWVRGYRRLLWAGDIATAAVGQLLKPAAQPEPARVRPAATRPGEVTVIDAPAAAAEEDVA